MAEENLKTKIKKGFIWKFGEKIVVQLTQLIIQIILARILFPDDFGVLAILNVFIALCDVFILYSFSSALIRKNDADQIDFSSVFYFNVVFSIFLYFILFFTAPLISYFYEMESLTNLLRVLSLNIIIGSLSSIQNVLISKRLNFKITFFKSFLVVLSYAAVSIAMAMNGFGVWSLVVGKVVSTLVGTLALVVMVRWIPSLSFSYRRMKSLFSFSSKILGTNLLSSLFQNFSSLIIGKYYTTEDLGYYNKGQQLPQTAMVAIDGSLSEVLYPSMSIVQEDEGALKSMLSRSLSSIYFVVTPIMIGGLVVAPQLIPVLLTDKWINSIPFFQLQCIICMFWPMNAEHHMLNAKGMSKITFFISLSANLITFVFILIGVRYSIYIIMIGTIVGNLISVVLSSVFAKKYCYYGFVDLLKDIGPSLFTALTMGVIVYFISYLPLSRFFVLCIQILVGFVYYFALSILIKNKGMFFLKNVFLKRK